MPALARSCSAALVLTVVACGGDGGAPGSFGDAGATSPNGGGTPAPSGQDAAAPQPGQPAPGQPGPAGDASAPPPPVTGSDGGASVPPPVSGGDGGAATIPQPTGACPTIANGDVTFAPAGIPARQVAISMTDAAKTLHGPLVIYWHGTSSSPLEAGYALGATITAIEAAGGIVAAPYHDTNAGQFPWYLVSGSTKQDDLLVADEVVACLAKSVGIDTTHIHTMGFSAGGLQTTAMSYLRSSYLASVVTFSGGLPQGETIPAQDPANKLAALIFDGGSSDNAYGFDFQAASQLYETTFKSAGHFAALCNHGMGHAIPTAAAPSVWTFFQANGFGVSPSPYAAGLPASFPSYCSL